MLLFIFNNNIIFNLGIDNLDGLDIAFIFSPDLSGEYIQQYQWQLTCYIETAKLQGAVLMNQVLML
jgi:hypothetical protein